MFLRKAFKETDWSSTKIIKPMISIPCCCIGIGLAKKIMSMFQALTKRGNKKVKPVYEDNGDCVLLYACGWQEYSSLPSNSHIKHNCGGGDAAGCCSGRVGQGISQGWIKLLTITKHIKSWFKKNWNQYQSLETKNMASTNWPNNCPN